MKRALAVTALWIVTWPCVCGLCSCAQVSQNDGLVPRMSAQANLPFEITPPVVGGQATPLKATSGGLVYPLNETRKAYWTTP